MKTIKTTTLVIVGFLLCSHLAKAQKTFTFQSLDGLLITADIYNVSGKIQPKSYTIVLCHQAKYSRGEFRETANKLNNIGYNCLVPDLRSGVEVNDVRNQTHFRALDKHLPTDYLDAEQDIVAVVNFAFEKYDRKIILLGSSYSASLALKIGKGNKKVAAIIAFSPGEYFGKKLNLRKAIAGLKKPVFLTSTRKESQALAELAEVIKSNIKIRYIPKTAGFHGSKALWSDNEGNEGYWKAMKEFLRKIQ